MQLDIRVDRPDLTPTRANPTDAGLDLRCSVPYYISQGVKELVDTGVSVRIPKGYVGLLVQRSGLGKKNLALANSVGIIDSDYRGNLLVNLFNYGTVGATLAQGERIAQLLVVPIALPSVNEVRCPLEEWLDTDRGDGGFGSTGSV